MIWAVLDTNTVVSGFGWSGAPAQVVDFATRGEFVIVTSPALLEELERVLKYPKLRRAFPEPEGLVELVREVAEVVGTIPQLNVCSDEADNRVLEAGVAGNADVIVTGDAALKGLNPVEGIQIVDAREFLRILEGVGQ